MLKDRFFPILQAPFHSRKMVFLKDLKDVFSIKVLI